MGFRFRRSIKLAPGVRMNLSKSGVSWSLGPRGFSVSTGKRGTYLNAGIPGTGISYRERIDGSTSRSGRKQLTRSEPLVTHVTVHLNNDGTLSFIDEYGNPASPKLVSIAKRNYGKKIRQLLEQRCEEINAQVEVIENIYLNTPDSTAPPRFKPESFKEPKPSPPILKVPNILQWLLSFVFPKIQERIDQENAEMERAYKEALRQWEERKEAFEEQQKRRKQLIEEGIYKDTKAMEDYLESLLSSIRWPRETLVSFDILENGGTVVIDVDLPEIEDMPTQIASVPNRGYKLSVKNISQTQLQRLYMRHVHGIGFRIIGEVFAALPTVRRVVLSAYSQRPDPATGHIRDDYLYSLIVPRAKWEKINFQRLNVLNPVEAMACFEMRRDMTKTGRFKPINPFTLEELQNEGASDG